MDTSGEDQGHRAAVRRLFDETRRRLVETGTRNRLIHVNRQSRRSNVLDVINERSDDIHALLATSRRTMQFLATGRDKDDDSDTPKLTMRGEAEFGEERFTDAQLETRLGPDGLQKRLLKLARDAKTAEEEQGINILYLALGFLSWFEDGNSAVRREAPLVLLPVELVRNARTSSYDIRLRDDDIVTNLPLQERLKGDFGLRLPEIEIDETWTPSRYFDAVDAVIANRARWSIDRDGMQLGFFSFAKLLMFHDLNPDNWPENALEEHELTRGLLHEGFEPEEPMFGKDDRLDPLLPPGKMFHVVDADASQAKVIEEVRSGRNLVVQGPPGTGKSQTITNIIAAAVHEGRRVLFVAEKMAALSVVHQRLVKSGLRDVCLELHSKTANKKAVLAELAQTLNAAQAIPAMPPEPAALEAARDQLNEIDAALHAELGACGETPFSVLAQQVRFAGTGAPPPTLRMEGIETIDRARAAQAAEAVRSYAGALSRIGPLSDHPFFGTRALTLQPVDIARLKVRLEEAADAARRGAEAVEAASAGLGIRMPLTAATGAALRARLSRLANPPGIDDDVLIRLVETGDKTRLRETLSMGADWRRARDAADPIFVDQAWTADAGSWRAHLLAGVSSFFARWGKGYRGASRQLAALLRDVLPKTAADRVARLDALLTVAALRESWRQDEIWAASALGDAWRGERTDFASLLIALDWSARASEGDVPVEVRALIALGRDARAVDRLATGLDAVAATDLTAIAGAIATLDLDLDRLFDAATVETCALPEVEARLRGMAAAEDRYDEWAKLCLLLEAVRRSGLDGLLAAIDGGAMSGDAAATEFLYARAEAIWKQAIAGAPLLAALRNLDRHAAVTLFADLEKGRRGDAVKTILAHHLKQVPSGARGTMATVRGELGKKRAHMPLRKFFAAAGEAIQRIKPVLLMSPISVAQYLKPGAAAFDLLVIDEASQVRPEDALGAIARAGQIVVVGDQKQLPPSAFFDRLSSNGGDDGDDEEDGETAAALGGAARVAEMESILTLCEARGLGGRMLEWHYRSRDPSLIRVSNVEFYKGGLILPPSPLQNDPAYGLIFTRVAGAYDRGGKRDNRIEGEAIVRRVAEHARATPDVSLGIVTFSSAQRNLITELLEFERRQDAALDDFLRESVAEEVFVKNIENVQGDERDVILVSVGYGPTQTGARLASMNFGPVNVDGGERRLNVLFTRARLRCEVFASFDPGDIDLAKVSKAGPRVLKRFLEFAQSGQIDEPSPAADGPDTDFEKDVADAIADLGYPVDHQVGSAGFLIDLGVKHPERPGSYILAVECDGATYHSAIWARERDRLRQDVLEHLGWRFHRVWSTDWFYRKPAEIERLRLALQAAKIASAAGFLPAAAKDRLPPADTPPPAPEVIPLAEPVDRAVPAYEKARLPMSYGRDLHSLGANAMADLALKVVEAEGPVHQDEVARRIAASFGKERAGGKTVAAVVYGLRYAARRPDSRLQSGEAFWWTAAQAAAPAVRDRSAEAGPLCKAAYIAMSEIEAALRLADEDNVGGSDQDIIRSAARLFGFRRVGPDLQQRLARGLELLEREPA